MNKEELLKKIHVVSDAVAEQCDYLVCVPADVPSPYTDNLTAFCVECGVKVHHRWHAPIKPKRICIYCMVKLEERLGKTEQ